MPVVPHAALLFVATLAASLNLVSSSTQSCSVNDAACDAPEVAHAGAAMIQSKMSTSSDGSDAPLTGRISTALAEVSSLQARVDAIMQSTGYSGGSQAAGALQTQEKVLNKDALYARYKELLHTKKYDESSVKEDVATLETETAALKSNVLMLENQVQGESLVQAKSSGAIPTSLKTRVEAVEQEISDLRTRVTSLEQVVIGLHQTKAEKAALMQTGSSTKTKLGPLSARLTALEKEVDSLTTRTDTLETTIQGSGGGALLEGAAQALPSTPSVKKARFEYESLLQEAAQSGEGTIKERTASLEASVAGLKSKMAMLENQAVGRTSSGSELALLQTEEQGSGSSLKARITGLEDEVDSLRTRVTTLEHVVEG